MKYKPVGHCTQRNGIECQTCEVLSRVNSMLGTEPAEQVGNEITAEVGGRTYRSHFRMSCEATSSISGNISRMETVPNAGMRRRSASRNGISYIYAMLAPLFADTHAQCPSWARLCVPTAECIGYVGSTANVMVRTHGE